MNQPPYPMSGDYPSYGQYSAPSGAAPGSAPPPSNAGWAVATILFFWPLAFSAFNHLHDIYPRWAMGDHQGALEASARVKSLGKTALWIFVGVFVGFFVLYGVIIAAALSAVGGAYR